MLPITINTPKPLVDVNGQRIIETLLNALLAADITEIYIVTGYKRECFELLKRDYPMVTLLENPIYASTNNISSACVAKDHFSNAMYSKAICTCETLRSSKSTATSPATWACR